MAGECQLYHCVLLYSSRSNWQVIQEASPSFCLLLLRLPPPPPPPLSVPVPLFCSCCCCLLIFPIATVVVLSLPPRTALHFNPRGSTVLCCAVLCDVRSLILLQGIIGGRVEDGSHRRRSLNQFFPFEPDFARRLFLRSTSPT